MRVLDRKLVRDIWRIKGQALAIALVIACGAATLVMAFGTLRSLETTRDAYYERYRFADIWASVKRAPESLVNRLVRIPGVGDVQSRIIADVTIDIETMAEPATGRLVSREAVGGKPINDVAIRRGRDIAADRWDEILVSEPFAEAHGLSPGDDLQAIIKGRKRRLSITGIALSPEFIYATGGGQLMPDDRRFGVLWMGREALAAAFDLSGAFNQITVRLTRDASERQVIGQIDGVLERYGGAGAIVRDEHVSHAFLKGEIEGLGAMGRVIPPIFLGVSAFLLNMVVARLIETEREQIGLLKAFGYGDLAVGWHYAKMVLLLVAVGMVIGLVGGTLLGRGLTELYATLYRFPFLDYRANPPVFVIAIAISIAAALIGTATVVWRAVKLPPAVAMVPAPPTSYRSLGLERLGLFRVVSQPTRMIARHLTRWPVRAGLAILGLSLSVAVLIGSMFGLDAINHMIDVTYAASQRQHVTVTFEEPRPRRVIHDIKHLPGVLATEPVRSVAARIRFGHKEERLAITGLPQKTALSRLLDESLRPVAMPRDGLVVTSKLASLLGVTAGRVVTVAAMEGRRPVVQVPVAAVVQEYVGLAAYMNLPALNRLMGEGPTISGVHMLVDDGTADTLYRALKDAPAVAGVLLKAAAIQTFRATIAETMMIAITFYIGFAGLIAFGVAFNSARIALSERARELASLRVLGFTRGEVTYILLGEQAILTFLALPLGCGLGYLLAWLASTQFETDLFRIPLVVAPSTYGIAVSTAVAAAVLSGLIVRRRLDRLDLVSALKVRE